MDEPGIRVVGAERSDGLELRTRGLAALGLPELRTTALPPYLGHGWARVLGAVAQRLAALGGTVPPRITLPGEGEVVTVDLEAVGDDLVPVPPSDLDAPVAQWQRDVVAALFPSARS